MLRFAIAVLFSISSAIAQTNQVQGVTPGMYTEQAIAAFRSDKPGIVVKSTNYTTAASHLGPVSSIRGCDGEDCTTVAFGALQGRSYFITRSWQPQGAKLPEFLATAEHQFGPLSIERSTPFGAVYSSMLNSRGKQDAQCRTTAAYGVPHTANPNCTVSVSLDVVVQDGVVTKARLAVFDQRELINEIRSLNARR